MPRATEGPIEAEGLPLQVVASAGHVDHGKSALILRLTGMDPDRLAEEKRRGLTIDLGFAWTVLPSGREVGFVDVPGHERFIRNMLAGMGPVRLVLFVVSADEGWKPQSEEHLQIVDVLGVRGAVIALTKRDLVDEETLGRRREQIRARVAGTRIAQAPILSVSAVTGDGLDDLRVALDGMLAEAPDPEQRSRPRQFLDRVFTIRGAGTVVTGTLTGGPIAVGQEAEILPSGQRARIRGLQTHKRSLEVARPDSRVAVNLAGTSRTDLERGDALTLAGQWRPTFSFEGWVRPVRGLDHPLTSRGAYKLYVGAAERDARIRLYGAKELSPGERAFARLTMNRPVVLDFRDPFVLREAGRRETVAGGEVLDTDPPARPGPDPITRLRSRLDADRVTLAGRVVSDRGAIRASDLHFVAGTGSAAAMTSGAKEVGSWMMSAELEAGAAARLTDGLRAYHRDHPLRRGLEMGEVRGLLAPYHPAFEDQGLGDAFIEHLARAGVIARDGSIVRLPDHSVRTAGHDDADRLVSAVASAEPTPPTIRELAAAGFGQELIRAACLEGRLVDVSRDVVVTPSFLARAEDVVRQKGTGPGLTVSSFREALGTSRKYALPLLEYFDRIGLTRRQGDYRILRGASPAPDPS
jgi:selenocysteine-specific elongation factor